MADAPSPRGNVRAFGATSFCNDTATEMAYWVLPAFLMSLGAGPEKLGVIEGIAESVASLAKLGSGYLTDHLPRRKPLVVAGYTLANIVKPILAIATSWWQVLFIRFADRTAKGLRGAPRDVMLAESVERERLGSAFGLLQAMDSAGAIAGPLLAILILRHFDLRAVFWAAAIPGLLAIVIVSLFARETGKAASPKHERQPIARTKLPASFYGMLVAVTLFSLGNSSDMFLVLRAQDVGIGATLAPLLGLVFNIVYTAGSWPAGHLSDRIPRKYVAAAGYAIFAAVYFVFAAAPSRSAIWAMMAFYGLYYALTSPVLRALVVDEVPKESRGRALGIFYFATSVATLLSSVLTGILWKTYGAAVPLNISAALALVSAVLLLGFRSHPVRA